VTTLVAVSYDDHHPLFSKTLLLLFGGLIVIGTARLLVVNVILAVTNIIPEYKL
jgi:hypothetical protein